MGKRTQKLYFRKSEICYKEKHIDKYEEKQLEEVVVTVIVVVVVTSLWFMVYIFNVSSLG